MPIANYIRSWLLVVPLIPSVIINIINLYHLLRSRALRTALNNHVIILLLFNCLFISLSDIPWEIYYYRNDRAVSFTSAFCQTWIFISSFGPASVYILTAWTSIERHFLIFHSSLFGTARKRLIFHYLPTAICMVWPVAFYFVMFFIVPCDVELNYNRKQCSQYGCITGSGWPRLLDSFANYILPTYIIVTFSVALIVRVMYRKRHMHRRIEWRKYKKMVTQLLPISFIYLSLALLPITLYAAYTIGVPYSVASSYFDDSLFFFALVTVFTPFATVTSLPELRPKCEQIFLLWRRRRIVVPNNFFVTRAQDREAAVVPPVAHQVMFNRQR